MSSSTTPIFDLITQITLSHNKKSKQPNEKVIDQGSTTVIYYILHMLSSLSYKENLQYLKLPSLGSASYVFIINTLFSNKTMLPKMRSLFMPTSKHFFNRQCGQNLRVFTSILQLPSKIHFVGYNKCNTNTATIT